MNRQAIAAVSLLSGVAFTIAFDAVAAPSLAPDVQEPDASAECGTCELAPAAPVVFHSRAEQAISETIISVDRAPLRLVWTCDEPRPLTQGSGTVRTCEYRPLAKAGAR